MNFCLFENMAGFCLYGHSYINLTGSHKLTNKQGTCKCCEGLQMIVYYSYIVIKSM